MANESTFPQARQDERPPQVSAEQQAAQQQKESLLQQVHQEIANLRARTDIPEDVRARLIGALEGALSNGNINYAALANILADTQKQATQAVAAASLDRLESYEIAHNYPDYNEYSRESQNYISDQYRWALQNSPVLQSIQHTYEALPEEDRKEAAEIQAANWNKLKSLRENPEYAEYTEQLRVMKNLGLHSMQQGTKLLEMIEQKRPIEEIQAELDKAIEARAKLAEPVIKDMISKIDPKSRAYLEEQYGAGAQFDTKKLVEDWSKVSTKDRDAAYAAYAKNGKDISKLTPEQQRIVHMSQLMIPSDAALPLQAATQMSQNKELAAKLTDKDLSVGERADVLKQYMVEHGMDTSGRFASSNINNVIEAIDHNPSAFEQIKTGNMSAFAQSYQTEILNDMGIKAEKFKGDVFSTDLVLGAYVSSYTFESTTPAWLEKLPQERQAAYTAQQSEWSKTAESLLSSYALTTPLVLDPAIVLPPLGSLGVSDAQQASPATEKSAPVVSAKAPDDPNKGLA